MPINGMVRQYLDNPYRVTCANNKCSRSGFTDYVFSVAHITGRTQTNIANFSCSLNLHIPMCSRRSSGGSFFCIQSVLSELLLDENVLIITHTKTLVMRVFCHIP